MDPTIKKGIYQHYKGNKYEVIGLARHSETRELFVVYKALYETEFGKDSLWVRPIEMFKENVMVNGKTLARFLYLSEKLKKES